MAGLISNGSFVLGDPNTRDLYIKTPLTTGFEGDKYYIGLDNEWVDVPRSEVISFDSSIYVADCHVRYNKASKLCFLALIFKANADKTWFKPFTIINDKYKPVCVFYTAINYDSNVVGQIGGLDQYGNSNFSYLKNNTYVYFNMLYPCGG